MKWMEIAGRGRKLRKVDEMDDSGWLWMKMDGNGLEMMKVD